jgi:hypothetical protein
MANNSAVADEPSIKLGSIIDEVKKHTDDQRVIGLLTDYIEWEKTLEYSYKEKIRELLDAYVADDAE